MKLNNWIIIGALTVTGQNVLAQKTFPGTLTPGKLFPPASAEQLCQFEANEKIFMELVKGLGTWNQNPGSAHINEVIWSKIIDETSFLNQVIKRSCTLRTK